MNQDNLDNFRSLLDNFRSLPQYEEWKENGQGSFFLGVPVKDMSREDLMAVIGWLNKEQVRVNKQHQEEREFMRSLDKFSSSRPSFSLWFIIAGLVLLCL